MQNGTDTEFGGELGPLRKCNLNQIVQGRPESPSNWVSHGGENMQRTPNVSPDYTYFDKKYFPNS